MFNPNEQPKKKKSSKNCVDIMFCIDKSWSMTSCIDGLKDNIKEFVKGLEIGNNQQSIDFRIGFLAYNSHEFTIKDFTNNTDEFVEKLNTISVSGDEMTMPAIDWSLDTEWREEKVHKVVIILTDEKLYTGVRVDLQKSKMKELEQKVINTGIQIFFIVTKSANCNDYRDFTNNVGGFYEITESFDNLKYSEFFNEIGKSVSSSLHDLQSVKANIDVKKDLYELIKNNIVKIQKI